MATKKLNLVVEAKGVKKAEGQFKSMGKSIGGVANVMKGVFAVAVLAGAKHLVNLAAKAEGVEFAFNRLNKPELLDNLRKATKNTVTDLALMQRAVQARNFKIPLEQLGILLKFAQQRARETGESVDFLVESLVLGIGRKSVMILDNLGLSAIEVREKFKQTGDMAKAVGIIIQEEFAKNGEMIATTADKIDATAASFQNMLVSLGEMIVAFGEATLIWDSAGAAMKFLSLHVEGFKNLFKDFLGLFKEVEQVERATEIMNNFSKQNTRTSKSMRETIEARNAEIKAIREQSKNTIFLSKAEADFRRDRAETIEKTKQLAEFEFNLLQIKARSHELQKAINIDQKEFVGILGQQIEEIPEVENKWKDLGDTAAAVGEDIMRRNQFLFETLSGTLTNAVIQGEGAFKQIFFAFRSMLQQMAAEIAARSAIFGLLSIFDLAPGGGFLRNILPFAEGGEPPVNRPSLVGERGPELFVPRTQGTIIPNDQLGGLTVNFYGNVTDKRFVDDFVIPRIMEAQRGVA